MQSVSKTKVGVRSGSRSHRLIRTVYIARASAFAYCFVTIGLLMWERAAGVTSWVFLALTFLVYPQFAYLAARAARYPSRAEQINLLFDSLLFGLWSAQLGYPIWVTYATLAAAMLNNLVNRGLQGLAQSFGLFALGACIWGALRGFEYVPHTSPPVTALCFFGSLAYACLVGLIVHRQNRRVVLAREKLRMSEERYRLIAENAADLIALLDAEGRWCYVSPAYAHLLPAEDLRLGMDAFRRTHPEDVDKAREAFRNMVETGAPAEFDMRLVCADGAERVFECIGHAVRDAFGERSRVVLVSRDVTELHKQREQLNVAALAFENMTEAIMVSAADGRIVSVNKAFARITGFSAEEVVGHQESEFRLGMQPPEFYTDLYAQVLRSGYWSGSTWSRRKDGGVYREWRTVSAVRDQADHIAYYVAVFFEMDESKHPAGPISYS